ncbi:MAG: tRNA (N(6)-L-threonylcarbamoyladenosine(37)-C(2))-methylthiotransferase MtaB [bacterium]|nr:tRNA (N(6)-L-threonylcarbamoyladenosine(37)-C(2))-methylthiotransferase MtaB [bacterium]
MRFHVHNLGCKVNRVESDNMSAALISAGHTPAPLAEADVAIVNTCTVTSEADHKTRKAIRRASRECAGPVIATGCATAIDPEALGQLGENVIVEPSRQLAIEKALAVLEREAGLAAQAPNAHPRAAEGFHTRMGIKVQDGCNNRCTYCIVNKARGRSASMPLESVVSEVALASESGIAEVVLTGINIGSYREVDDSGRMLKLPQLIEALLERTGIGRIRLSSIEPPDVDDKLIALLERYRGRFCAHLHMPLQSGCDRTLAAMGRLYDTADFARRVEAIYAVRPDASITTDVIAGFPQETDADFAQTLEFCRRMRFSKIHAFRYSVRPGTPAAEMVGQVDPRIKVQRASSLHILSDELRCDDMLRRVGSRELVVVETGRIGMSESYHEVVVEGEMPRRGEMLELEFTGIEENARLMGKRI